MIQDPSTKVHFFRLRRTLVMAICSYKVPIIPTPLFQGDTNQPPTPCFKFVHPCFKVSGRGGEGGRELSRIYSILPLVRALYTTRKTTKRCLHSTLSHRYAITALKLCQNLLRTNLCERGSDELTIR